MQILLWSIYLNISAKFRENRIDPYNFELYRFKVCAFFLRHSVYAAIRSVCNKTNLVLCNASVTQVAFVDLCCKMCGSYKRITFVNCLGLLFWRPMDDVDETRLLLRYKETKIVGFCVSQVTHFYFTDVVLVKNYISTVFKHLLCMI